MLPKLLKNFNLFVDGRGYAGLIEELTLPKLTMKMEEYQGAGMFAPVEIEMGMEKLEMDMTLAEVNPRIMKLFGLSNGDEFEFTIRGVQRGNGLPQSVVIHTRGIFKEFDFDAWKASEKSTIKCSIACSSYEMRIDGIVIMNINPITMTREVDGVNQLAIAKQILGM